MGTMEWPHPLSSSLLSGSHLGGGHMGSRLAPLLLPQITLSPGPNPPNPVFSIVSVVSDSVRPHRRQPTRPRSPWGSLGKNTGVGCHFLLPCTEIPVPPGNEHYVLDTSLDKVSFALQ